MGKGRDVHVRTSRGPLQPEALPLQPVEVVQPIPRASRPEGVEVDVLSAIPQNGIVRVVHVRQPSCVRAAHRIPEELLEERDLEDGVAVVTLEPGVVPEERHAVRVHRDELEKT